MISFLRAHFFSRPLWRRLAMLAAIAGAGYLLLFVVFGKANMSWLVPGRGPLRWPDDLPFFSAETRPAADGKHEETLYTVPTRRFTAQETAELTHPPAASPATSVKAPPSPAPALPPEPPPAAR